MDYERALLNRLDRIIASLPERLVLLSPPELVVPDRFTSCEFDLERHDGFIQAIQRFRGDIYYEDGAITRDQLTPDGRHVTLEDDQAWHIVLMNEQGGISACAWYHEHANSVYFDRLRVRHSALAHAPEWREPLWRAVDQHIADARRNGLRYAELGGWAVARESRSTSETLLLALATYAVSRLGGGALGITTATNRHHSSSILCRLGGHPLDLDGVALPPYYDPHYDCVMEILRFDSRAPHARYERLVQLMEAKIFDMRLVARPYWPPMRSTGYGPVGVRATRVPPVPDLAA